jgi:hypothetical protein
MASEMLKTSYVFLMSAQMEEGQIVFVPAGAAFAMRCHMVFDPQVMRKMKRSPLACQNLIGTGSETQHFRIAAENLVRMMKALFALADAASVLVVANSVYTLHPVVA